MDRSFLLFLVRFVFVGAGINASGLFAYPVPVDFSGRLTRWNISPDSGPILYEVVGNDLQDVSFYGSVVDDAASLWNEVPSSYAELQPAEASEAAMITIRIRSSLGDDAAFSAGFSSFDKHDSDAHPTHCSIDLLAGVSYLSFAKTTLHELGHCLGLGHSTFPKAIMSYNLQTNSFGLDVDDIAAVSRLYPTNGSSPKLPPGCSVRAEGRTGAGRWLLLLLVTMPLVAAVHTAWSELSRPQDSA